MFSPRTRGVRRAPHMFCPRTPTLYTTTLYFYIVFLQLIYLPFTPALYIVFTLPNHLQFISPNLKHSIVLHEPKPQTQGTPTTTGKSRFARIGSVRLLGRPKKKPVLYIVFIAFNYLRSINPQWQQTTVLHESKSQIEKDRPPKLTINSRDTLYRRKVKRFARTIFSKQQNC